MLFESLTQHNNKKLLSAIDSTCLTFSSGANEADVIRALCQEAMNIGFYAVCVHPRHGLLARQVLYGSQVKLACVVGFPQQKVSLDDALGWVGHVPLLQKQKEAERCLMDGADELDWVLDIESLKQDIHRHRSGLNPELTAISNLSQELPVKVIIETDLLLMPEIVKATQWCAEANAAMVKTSTGMIQNGVGATVENIQTIYKTLQRVNTNTRIKASGGIKTRDQALLLLDSGAVRLGTSQAALLVKPVNQQAL
jgi:deoxyribose-phosphate aldolase